jgi:endonuclease YncB( thermonuclease family)
MKADIDSNIPKPEHLYTYRAVVRSNYDGDTVRVDIDLGMGHVWRGNEGDGIPLRLLGIDTPELQKGTAESKAKGREAKHALTQLLPTGSSVLIRTVRDATEKFGRYLVVIVSESGVVVNSEMIISGHAKPYSV